MHSDNLQSHNTHKHHTHTDTHTHTSTDHHGRLQAVHVMTAVTLITQQHFLSIALAATDAAASQKGRAIPLDALVQCSKVKKNLRQTGAAQHRLFPAIIDTPPSMFFVWRVYGRDNLKIHGDYDHATVETPHINSFPNIH